MTTTAPRWSMILRLVGQGLAREWRAGDLRFIALAIVLAVAGLTAVAAVADRLHRSLDLQGAELLGADLVVRTSFALEPDWADAARGLGLSVTRTVSLRSVVSAGTRSHLVEVKGVEEGYPLRGAIRLARSVDDTDAVANGPPSPGHAWADPQLPALLEAGSGSALRLGGVTLDLSGVLTLEPDRGASSFSIAPRLMVNRVDLAASGLILPGSIVTYRLLLAGAPEQLAAFRDWLEPRLTTGVQVLDTRDARPRFRVAVDRAERFFRLASLLAVLIAGFAVARAAMHYAERNMRATALMRCLGATYRETVAVYGLQLLIAGLIAGVVGAAVGYLGQQALIGGFGSGIGVRLPAPSVGPGLLGVAVAMLLLAGFAGPQLLRLRAATPLAALHRQLPTQTLPAAALYLPGALCFAALALWLVGDPPLVAYVLGATVATLAGLAAASRAMLALLARVRHVVPGGWRYGIAALVRRRGAATVQAVLLGVVIMALLLLSVVRIDLLHTWQRRLPPETPNHFLINLEPGDLPALGRFLTARGLREPASSPMLRARLTHLNHRVLRPDDYTDPFARSVLGRAANLSWRAALPDDNRVVAGRWWTAADSGRALVSVERDYAAHLGLVQGDVLTYRIGDRDVELSVDNLREVSWDSFRPNFFLLTPPGTLDGMPVTYIASVYVPPGDTRWLRDLVERFPHVTDIDVSALLRHVRSLLDRLAAVLGVLLGFALVCGVVVLLVAIHTSYRERRHETALLRTLGAGRRLVWRALLVELIALGVVAGLLGALGATVGGWLLARYLLDLPYTLNATLWWAGPLAGMAVVGVSGAVATWPLVRTPPWRTLQQARSH